MAATFSQILVLLTLFTGIIWTLDKFILAPKRQLKIDAAADISGGQVDAVSLAKVAPQPAWIETPASMFPVLGLVLILRSFIYEPFQIPSGSMMPTLLVGDFILVEKFSYGLRDPMWRNEILETGKPERGDVIVFKYPVDPTVDYIKRVVGLPGDTVTYTQEKKLCIQKAGEGSCEWIPLTDVQVSQFSQGRTDLIQATEQLAENGSKHQILVNPYAPNREAGYSPRPGVNTWVVPEGNYFAMGDNRDNSADSRFWGFVPEENLVGKAVGIWISFEFERSRDSVLPSWIPTDVRFNRVGGID